MQATGLRLLSSEGKVGSGAGAEGSGNLPGETAMCTRQAHGGVTVTGAGSEPNPA